MMSSVPMSAGDIDLVPECVPSIDGSMPTECVRPHADVLEDRIEAMVAPDSDALRLESEDVVGAGADSVGVFPQIEIPIDEDPLDSDATVNIDPGVPDDAVPAHDLEQRVPLR